jgi:uncharacterized protein YoxC
MVELEDILVILSIVFLLFAVFCIPFLLQILRTAKSMDRTLRTFNQNLPGIMKNLEEITTNINLTTATVHRQVDEVSMTVRKVQGALGLVVGVEEIFRSRLNSRFMRIAKTSFAVAKGVRVFLDYLVSERSMKR